MMKRRKFLAFLSMVPVIGWFIPKAESSISERRLSVGNPHQMIFYDEWKRLYVQYTFKASTYWRDKVWSERYKECKTIREYDEMCRDLLGLPDSFEVDLCDWGPPPSPSEPAFGLFTLTGTIDSESAETELETNNNKPFSWKEPVVCSIRLSDKPFTQPETNYEN